MTYRAMVDSQHKSPLKKRRMQNSSDAIQQEVSHGTYSATPRGSSRPSVKRLYVCVFSHPTVHGSANALHRPGHAHDPVCEVRQRDAETGRGGGGEAAFFVTVE